MLLRLHAAGLLEEHGFAVLEAANATGSMNVLQSRGDVQLLFTDIRRSSALDGMDLVREVHARWPRVLLVIASGRRKPSQAEIPDDGRFWASLTEREDFSRVDDLMRKRRVQTSNLANSRLNPGRHSPFAPGKNTSIAGWITLNLCPIGARRARPFSHSHCCQRAVSTIGLYLAALIPHFSAMTMEWPHAVSR